MPEGPTLNTSGWSPAPCVVVQAGSLRDSSQLVGSVAQVLQGEENVVGPIHQEVVPVCWLGWDGTELHCGH